MNYLTRIVLSIFCLLSIQGETSEDCFSCRVERKVEIEVAHGKDEIESFLDDLASLTLENYSPFPYLIISTHEEEKEYLSEHLRRESAIVVLAKDQGKVIGAITGHPFSESPDKFLKSFNDAGIPTNDMFYLGDIILKKEYRGQKTGREMYEQFLTNVLDRPQFNKIALCEIIRSKDDPRRPIDYFSLDEFWTRRGFVKHPELNCTLYWQEPGEEEESPKLMVFWVKKIQ